MSSPAIEIKVSDTAVKVIVGGALVLGVIWLINELTKDDEPIYLPPEAKTFAQLPALNPKTLNEVTFHPGIVSKIRSLFESGHYRHAVFEACQCLFEIIRQRSGVLEKDGATLIDVVFFKQNILTFQKVTEPQITGCEEGFKHGLLYFAKSVRNPIAHAQPEIPPIMALSYITQICFLGYQVENHTIKSAA
jgi:uncharacterized protein (TIGR02391 family)